MKKYLPALLLVFMAGIGCAEIYLVPDLPQRTLYIDVSKPGSFYYDYIDCTGHFLGVCTGKTLKRDHYDLLDPMTLNKLHDMGFVLKVREKN